MGKFISKALQQPRNSKPGESGKMNEKTQTNESLLLAKQNPSVFNLNKKQQIKKNKPREGVGGWNGRCTPQFQVPTTAN